MARDAQGEQSAPLAAAPGAAPGGTVAVRAWAVPLAAGASALAVYLVRLAPTVGPGDSAELAAAAIELGVPHPTGYPLYMLLGHVWSRLAPGVDLGWWMNLSSALFAAAAVGLLADFLRRLTGSVAAAWLGALSLALMPVFVAQATLTEVYALHLLLQVAILWLWICWEAGPSPRRLRGLVFLVGLSFTHHLMTVLVLPLLALALLTRLSEWWSPREALRLAGFALAPLLLYAYLPLAASSGTAIVWTELRSAADVIAHVLGGGYGGNLATPFDEGVRSRALRYPAAIVGQLGLAALVALLAPLALRDARRRVALMALGYATALLFALHYRVFDPDPFVLPSSVFLVALGALAAARMEEVARRADRRLAALVTALWAIAPAASLAVAAATGAAGDGRALAAPWASQGYRPHDEAMAALALLPEGATLLVWGDSNTPIYASVVEDVRPDVEVVELRLLVRGDYGGELGRLRADTATGETERIAAVLDAVSARGDGRAPVYALPVPEGRGWEALGYFVLDAGAVKRILPQPPDLRARDAQRTASLSGVAFASGYELVGVSPSTPAARAGEVLFVDYAWRVAPGRRSAQPVVVTSFAQLDGAGAGEAHGRAFHTSHRLGQNVDLSGYAVAEVFVERLALALPHGLEAGTWQLSVGLQDAAGLAQAPVARLEIEPGERRLWSLPRVYPPAPADGELASH